MGVTEYNCDVTKIILSGSSQFYLQFVRMRSTYIWPQTAQIDWRAVGLPSSCSAFAIATLSSSCYNSTVPCIVVFTIVLCYLMRHPLAV